MPTSSYFVNYIAHIDESRRPENFPRKVYDKQIFEAESIMHLQLQVNERFGKLISASGMVVMKNEDEPLTEGVIWFDKRVYVPWHMIAHMELEVKLIATVHPIQDSIVPGYILPDKPKELIN